MQLSTFIIQPCLYLPQNFLADISRRWKYLLDSCELKHCCCFGLTLVLASKKKKNHHGAILPRKLEDKRCPWDSPRTWPIRHLLERSRTRQLLEVELVGLHHHGIQKRSRPYRNHSRSLAALLKVSVLDPTQTSEEETTKTHTADLY
jgi:hypothetical protein